MRQLAHCSRTLCLAALARRSHRNHEEAASSLLSPSGLSLLAIRSTINASPLPAQAQAQAQSMNSSLVTNLQQKKQREPIDHLGAGPDTARWASALPVHPQAATAHTNSNPNVTPAAEEPALDSNHPPSAISTPPWPPSPPPPPLDQSPTPPSSSTIQLSSSHDLPDPIPSPTPSSSPSVSSTSSSYSPTCSPSSPAVNPAAGGYNEPRDGSFSGRIVQHDGSHAVHLLVSGTGTRDYHLRMVRCHARDQLLFGPRPGGSPQGAGPTCFSEVGPGAHNPATVRGEDVSFGTFMYRQVRDTITATFLPAGYPDTTGENYVKFMSWQGVNNVAVTASSVLASTFMLYAVGLGAGSIPTAGALNWVLKDGMGQLGTLLFGKTIAHNFDVHSKTWFFLSAVMLQAAAALELLTVLAPQHFLVMGSLANTLKGLAWMAAGSTRSVFHLSFARDNNIADVTAKGTSQYIFASLVGTAGGALMCAAVGQSGAAAAACFSLLATAAMGSAYMTVQAIPLTTLNATRLQLLVDAFLDSISPGRQGTTHGHATHGSGKRHHGHSHQQQRIAGSSSGSSSGGGGGGGGSRSARKRHTASSGGGGGYGSEGGGRFTARGGGSQSRYGTSEDDDEDDEYDDYYASNGGHRDVSRSGGVSSSSGGGGGSSRRWSRARAYRTVDRCYIGPSVHEYEMMYDDSLEPRVPTPLEVSPLDPPLPLWSKAAERLSPRIIVGSKLEHMVEGNANLLVMLLTTFKYAHFMVLPRPGGVHVLLHDKAEPRDMVQAYLQACILRRRLRDVTAPLPDPDEQTAELRLELQESLAAAERLTTVFMSAVEANGWTVSKIVVEAQRRRAKW